MSAARCLQNAKKRARRPRPRRPLTPEQQDLAARYLPMARALARPMKLDWPRARDEFESAALMALVEAAESFDPGRNVRFSTFARFRIQGALRDVQRRLALPGWRADDRDEGAPYVVSLGLDAEQWGQVLNVRPEPPVGQELEDADAVECWLRKLPAKHAAACREIYLHGRSQAEAAAVLGCSQSRLSFMHREALAMLNGTWYARCAAPGQVEN